MSTFPLRRLHTLCRMSSNGYVPPKTLPGKFDAILPTGVLLRANKTNIYAWHIRERRYLPT